MPAVNGNGSGPVAAVDLGSNSFHLIIGRDIGGQLSVLDRLRDPVRMAAGVDDKGRLDDETLERMLASLQRFGQRLRDIPLERKRAIGTNAFRRARRPRDVLSRASDALGFPIEVLSGTEEARLIYLGVSHDQPQVEGQRLVVDIGGGSTECILGSGFQPIRLDSFYMGCVSYSMRFFPGGELTKRGFREAEVAAKLELGTVVRRFRALSWSSCVGSSGTINAVAEILRGLELTHGPITLPAIKQLKKKLITAGSSAALDLPGLTADRAPVLPGGLAILKAVFESLHIESMRPSNAALREGLLYDLMGRIRHEDVRDRTIRSLSERYSVDVEQADRVERTALRCLDQVADAWGLDRMVGAQLLAWAARMHEIGLSLSYHGHHRHGAYILANSTMPGFSRQEQRRLAALVQGHRRKFSQEIFEGLAPEWREQIVKLCLLLRLAVRLNRARTSKLPPDFELVAHEKGLEIRFPTAWLDDHPLTRADLEEEHLLLSGVGFHLIVGEREQP